MGELLSIDAVTKGYWRGASYIGVLKDVSLKLEPGEIVALTARRLGGKSTLLEIVAGIEAPDAGTVLLAGRPVRATGQRTLHELFSAWRARSNAPVIGRDIIFVSRDGPDRELKVSKFVGGPLAVGGGRPRDVRLAAAKALELVGASSCADRRWGELSNYQRALVGLARAFAGSPQLVVLDDLLDAHDRRDTDALSDLLHRLVAKSRSDCAVLLSTGHYESAVVLADRVCVLGPKGRLAPGPARPPSDEQDPADNVVQLRPSAEGEGSSRDVG